VNHGWCAAMQKQEALQNLPAPVLQYVDINFLEPSNIATAVINHSTVRHNTVLSTFLRHI